MAARKAILAGIAWQRVHFHLQQNAQSYVTTHDKGGEIGNVLQSNLLSIAVLSYEKRIPKLAAWMVETIPEGFAPLGFPENHQRKVRTSNLLERLNKEIRRQTKVTGIFPNTVSSERLISAVLMEKTEEWLSGYRYLEKNVPLFVNLNIIA
jgi:putative transposase